MSVRTHKIYWLAGLIILGCIGSGFAYFVQELWTHNEFKTAKYDTVLKEEFISPDNWLPGEEINKDIWVTNNGTVSAFSKIILHQEWIREENVMDFEGSIVLPAEGEKFPLVFDTDLGKEYAAQIIWGDQTVLLASGKSEEIDLGLPVVECVSDAEGKWLLLNEKPDNEGNYTLYYIGLIGQGEVTPLVVDAVTMNPEIKPAIIQKNQYFDEKEEKWITQTERNSTYDYECSKYTMLVTATTVQATEDAVKEVFGTELDKKEVIDHLCTYVSSQTSFEPKKLYFQKKNDVMTWNPVRGSDGNWFMSFTNMIPGEEYEDCLQIENGSEKTYGLYMQVVSKQQDMQRDHLLELISMNVLLDSKMIYEGNASGKEYEDGSLQDVVYLGTYKPGEKSEISVHLKLDENVKIDDSDILTQNDWKFMVMEIGTTEKSPQVIQPPKTGDLSKYPLYIIVAVISLVVLVLNIVSKKRFFKGIC